MVIDIDKESRSQIVAWLTGQSFTNILLASVLSAIAYLGYYVLTIAMPGALKDVQVGYETINKENREDRNLIRNQHEKWLNMILKDKGREPITESDGK